MKDPIRKNLLDLHYQKYNSAMNTTIIIAFTLLISLGMGVVIGLLTRQLVWNSYLRFIVFILSLVTLLIGLILTGYFYRHTNEIINELKKLRREELNKD